MANKKNMAISRMNSLSVNGRIKNFTVLSIIMSVFVIVTGSCSSAPPIRPALDQTVINIQRSATKLDAGKLFVFVDDLQLNKKAPIKKGQFATYPINNGVHYIHVVCGKLVSDAINFSANSKTVSFVATIEKKSGFGNKLVITRSDVSNDTGRQTKMDIQESYGNAR
jgi:hypothetical protein